jgi:hypothetical protein
MAGEPDRLVAKKPPNAFMLFCQQNRSTIIAEDSGLPASEQSKRLSQRWRELPGPEKDAFRRQADDLYQIFHKQNPDFKYKQKLKPKKSKIADQLCQLDSLQLLNHMFQSNPLLLQQILSEKGEQGRPNVCKLFFPE